MLKTKICNKCNEEYPLTDEYFYKNKIIKDGYRGTCKSCDKKYFESKKEHYAKWRNENKDNSKKYKQDNRENLILQMKEWRIKNTEKVKEYAKKYREEHKCQISEHSKIYRIEHSHKVKQWNKEWCIKNKDRLNTKHQIRRSIAKQLVSTLTKQQWGYIKTNFNNRCAYCGEEKPLTQDHFIALSKGGEYSHNNIICVCSSCNSGKQAQDFFKWYPKQSFYSKQRELKVLNFLNYNKNKIQQLSIL